MKVKPLTKKPKFAIREAIEDIMKIIVRSDVRIGVSLSGGFDSSLLTVMAHNFYPKKICAFSVCYPDRPENDERAKAEKLAQKLKIPFYGIEIKTKEFVNDFPKMGYAMDDPIGDIAAYGYYRIMKKAREKKVSVLFKP